MTKYTVASQRRVRREEKQISPVWRGIGCIMIVVVPLLSYALAAWTVGFAASKNWPMPYQLMGFPVMPALLFKSDALIPILTFIQAQQDLYAKLLIAVIYVVLFGALLSLIWSMAYKVIGPPRYGPLDAPPSRVAPKRYKR